MLFKIKERTTRCADTDHCNPHGPLSCGLRNRLKFWRTEFLFIYQICTRQKKRRQQARKLIKDFIDKNHRVARYSRIRADDIQSN